jgi:hypothetical protein
MKTKEEKIRKRNSCVTGRIYERNSANKAKALFPD